MTYKQWDSVITYPHGKWKKVRSNQSTFYPKSDFPHWQHRFRVFTGNDLPRKMLLCPECRSLLTFRTVKSPFRASWAWKRAGKLKSKLKDSGWQARDQKKRTKERAKKCSWRKNWYVISDFVRRSVRPIWKKCTCFQIGDVHDRRRERCNRVYVLSRVRTNRVSLYTHNCRQLLADCLEGLISAVLDLWQAGHTYIHTGTYIHTYRYIHAYIPVHTCIHTYIHIYIHTYRYILPWTKKKNHHRDFAARRTLFHVWYHARSGATSAEQVRSATVRDFCPALIEHDITRGTAFFSPRISRMVLFFVQGSTYILLWYIHTYIHTDQAVNTHKNSATGCFMVVTNHQAGNIHTYIPVHTTLDKKKNRTIVNLLISRNQVAADCEHRQSCDCRDFTHRCIMAKSTVGYGFFDITRFWFYAYSWWLYAVLIWLVYLCYWALLLGIPLSSSLCIASPPRRLEHCGISRWYYPGQKNWDRHARQT